MAESSIEKLKLQHERWMDVHKAQSVYIAELEGYIMATLVAQSKIVAKKDYCVNETPEWPLPRRSEELRDRMPLDFFEAIAKEQA